MQPYWRWLVTKVPLWVAPNLLTFVGLLINLLTCLPVILTDLNTEGKVCVAVASAKNGVDLMADVLVELYYWYEICRYRSVTMNVTLGSGIMVDL